MARKAIDFVFSQSTVLEFGRETPFMVFVLAGLCPQEEGFATIKKCFFLKNDPACEIRERDGGACALMVPAFGRSFSLDFFFV